MKQHINFELKSDATDSFRCIKAANSVDLDLNKKLVHKVDMEIDFPDSWNIGLIVGASGSGKTTLTKHIFGQDCFNILLDENLPIIEQFDKNLSYDLCVEYLCGVGLSQVPCWIRPAKTLSNGQKFRAEIALQMANNSKNVCCIDEWTSVVDRTIGKIMSHCIQKHVRRQNTQIVLCSCHYDVLEWLQPDWIIDCNTQEFRRLLRTERTEKLEFNIREINNKSWKYFNKYHYLSEKLAGGLSFYFGIFHGNTQIGFQAFSNYVPYVKGKKKILHSNRTVIHPDYVGFGLGMKLIDETSAIIKKKGYRVMGKFSSISIYKSMIKNKNWILKDERLFTPPSGDNMHRGKSKNQSFRNKIKQWSFEYVGN